MANQENTTDVGMGPSQAPGAGRVENPACEAPVVRDVVAGTPKEYVTWVARFGPWRTAMTTRQLNDYQLPPREHPPRDPGAVHKKPLSVGNVRP